MGWKLSIILDLGSLDLLKGVFAPGEILFCMDSARSIDEESTRGSMWALEQRLDHPMEEEAERLSTMYTEKVTLTSLKIETYRDI